MALRPQRSEGLRFSLCLRTRGIRCPSPLKRDGLYRSGSRSPAVLLATQPFGSEDHGLHSKDRCGHYQDGRFQCSISLVYYRNSFRNSNVVSSGYRLLRADMFCSVLLNELWNFLRSFWKASLSLKCRRWLVFLNYFVEGQDKSFLCK